MAHDDAYDEDISRKHLPAKREAARVDSPAGL
jgi:hypothetical protein